MITFFCKMLQKSLLLKIPNLQVCALKGQNIFLLIKLMLDKERSSLIYPRHPYCTRRMNKFSLDVIKADIVQPSLRP